MGCWLDLARFEIGISESRAMWAVQWLESKSRERQVPLGELSQGLRRLVFIAGSLEHMRPLLGPLFAWTSQGTGEGCRIALYSHLPLGWGVFDGRPKSFSARSG